MNRYTRLGITLDLMEGRKVLYLTSTHVGARMALDEIWGSGIDGCRYRRVNGSEEIRDVTGSGWVRALQFASRSLQGLTPDVLVVPESITSMLKQHNSPAWPLLNQTKLVEIV